LKTSVVMSRNPRRPRRSARRKPTRPRGHGQDQGQSHQEKDKAFHLGTPFPFPRRSSFRRTARCRYKERARIKDNNRNIISYGCAEVFARTGARRRRFRRPPGSQNVNTEAKT